MDDREGEGVGVAGWVMTALTHKENELHNRLIVAEFNLGQVEEELRRLHEENLQWQEKCNTYMELHDAVVADSDRLYAAVANLIRVKGRHNTELAYQNTRR